MSSVPPRAGDDKIHSANLQRNCLCTELSRAMILYNEFLQQDGLDWHDRYPEDDEVLKQVTKYLYRVLSDPSKGYFVNCSQEAEQNVHRVQERMKLSFITDALESVQVNAVERVAASLKEDVCSVCLEKFDCETVYRIKSCNHVFHESCLRDHILQAQTCPLCRRDLSNDVWALK